MIPLLMVADALRADGWGIVNLGADVPRAELLATAQGHRHLRAVGISLSSERNAARTSKNIRSLRATRPDVPILLGGPAAELEKWRESSEPTAGRATWPARAKLVNELVARP